MQSGSMVQNWLCRPISEWPEGAYTPDHKDPQPEDPFAKEAAVTIAAAVERVKLSKES